MTTDKIQEELEKEIKLLMETGLFTEAGQRSAELRQHLATKQAMIKVIDEWFENKKWTIKQFKHFKAITHEDIDELKSRLI